ncbi:MAG: hypothetical protein CVU25_04715 [Betaproteobacteria bacterium HGW-Betaproteobacteria-19]|nr:MAG: hypothetical protein CVU25_04715 [Betaproteobacteria bacterium HGW-Betaproteobacteria-19]
MGIRQLVWALIAALLLYGGWQILRSLTADRRTLKKSIGEQKPAPPVEQPASLLATVDDEDEEDAGVADFDYAPVAATVPAPLPQPQPQHPGPDLFAFELEQQRLRRELGAVRAALDVQKEEINALHDAIRHLTEQGLVAAQSAEPLEQSASPEYSEALVLARRGLSVEEISTRCGITRAEAELVVSLAARGEGEGGA